MRTSAVAFGLAVLSFSLPVPFPGSVPVARLSTPAGAAGVTRFAMPAAARLTRFAIPAAARLTRFPTPAAARLTRFPTPAAARLTRCPTPAAARLTRFATPAAAASVGYFATPAAAAMAAAGAPYAGWIAAGRTFVEFDRSAGTAVEVVGDLATADKVVVLVPGVNTQLADFDRGLGGVGRRAPAVQARNILSQLHADDPGARVAVVAWLGYHPPDGVDWAAVTESRARSGAAALVGFVTSVQARRPEAEVTLVGHSYGSIVVGLAARELPAVHDVVVLGAPGLGVDSAADLPAKRVWSALAPTDWIGRIPQVRLFGLGHGPRPSSSGFGSTPLPTEGVAGHDYYLTAGSPTLDAVADVVLGRAA